MADVLIRDVPRDVHEELKRRARASGQTLQAYVAMLLGEHTGRPSRADWLARLDALPPVQVTISGVEAVRRAREDLP